MKTKQKLTPVTAPNPEPPAHLSERSQQLWRDLIHRARPISRQVLLRAALECLDRADQAREILACEGLTTTTTETGAVHIHPGAKVEREAKAQFLSIWSALGFQTGHDYSKHFMGASV